MPARSGARKRSVLFVFCSALFGLIGNSTVSAFTK